LYDNSSEKLQELLELVGLTKVDIDEINDWNTTPLQAKKLVKVFKYHSKMFDYSNKKEKSEI